MTGRAMTTQGQGMHPETVGEQHHALAAFYTALAARLQQDMASVTSAYYRALPHLLALPTMAAGPAAAQLGVAAARLAESWSLLTRPTPVVVDRAVLLRALDGVRALAPRPDPAALSAVLAALSAVVTMAPPGPRAREATPAPPAPMAWGRVTAAGEIRKEIHHAH
jgi:hypothetical protein